MKQVFIISVIFLSFIKVRAQQSETYSHYIFNYYALNPAASGLEKCYDVRFGRREQWVGFDGAPRTNFLTINKALGDVNSMRRNWHAIGGYMVDDETLPYSFNALYLSYAYHFRLHRNFIISSGLFLGMRHHGFTGIGATDDEYIGKTQTTWVLPDISPGIYLYSNTAFYGFSIKQAAFNDIEFRGDTVGSPSTLKPQFYFASGRYIKLDKNAHFMLKPSALVKYFVLYPPSIELNIEWTYNQRFGIGVGIRNTNAFIATIKFPLTKYFDVAYAYDYTLSKVRHGAANSHEVSIHFIPCREKKEGTLETPCPAFN